MVWIVLSLVYDTRDSLWDAACTLSVAVLILLLAVGTLLASVWTRTRTETPTEVEVVYIPESPVPTRHAYDPRDDPKTAKKRTPVSARRAGSRRLPLRCHRTRFLYSPRLQDDCGYAAVMKIAGKKKISKLAVASLRSKVACRFESAYLAGEVVAGYSVKQLVVEQELNLQSYLEATRQSQWASVVELHFACQQLGVSALYFQGKAVKLIGKGPLKGGISLRGSHYVVVRAGKKAREQAVSKKEGLQPNGLLSRAGMERYSSRSRSDPRRRTISSTEEYVRESRRLEELQTVEEHGAEQQESQESEALGL